MGKFISKISLIGVAIGLFAVAAAAPVSAHVTVKPAEAITAGYQTFTVSVPNERNVATTSVKVLVPESVKHITPTQKAGWNISIEKTGEGDAASVKSISWAGGEISDGTRDEFTFSAQVPEKETEIQWKAYQTYADGVLVSWDQAAEGGHGEGARNSGPFSVTKVVTETEQAKAIKQAQQAAASAQSTTRLALYSAITAVLLGLISIYLGTRKAK